VASNIFVFLYRKRGILEKRDSGASALREFFNDQWAHIQMLVQDNRQRREAKLTYNRHLSDAVEHIVDKVDNRIRGVGSYQNQLRCVVQDLFAYIQTIVDQLPMAITLDKSSFSGEPVVNTLFASITDLENLLHKSDEIIQFTHRAGWGDNSDLYAILCSIREDKSVFGTEVNDELIQRDVLQTAVNFYGHRIIAPAMSELEVRISLRKILFERAITVIRSHMVNLRHSQSLEEQKQAALNPEHNINNPEVYLRILSEQLAMPNKMIKLQNNRINVSKMGVLLPEDSSVSSNQLTLHELDVGDNLTHVVTLIRFNCDEWL